jgi:hypothetical protein
MDGRGLFPPGLSGSVDRMLRKDHDLDFGDTGDKIVGSNVGLTNGKGSIL